MTANLTPTPSSSSPNEGPLTTDHGTRSYQEKLLEWIDENFDCVIYPEEFEDCIVGIGGRYGGHSIAVMDVQRMMDKLQGKGMSHEQAVEYFETQVVGAYAGPDSPVYLHIPEFTIQDPATKREGTK